MTERKARAKTKTEAKADARGGGHSNAEIGLAELARFWVDARAKADSLRNDRKKNKGKSRSDS
jgi:hypothetical protein